MRTVLRVSLLTALVGSLALSEANADPVTFSTTGVFSVSGTNVVNFSSVNGTTTITFNGTTDSVNTPAGVSFGDIVVTTTVPANLLGPTVAGNFTLNVIQVSPAGAGSFVAALSGTLGFNTGVATLAFSTTSITINSFTYTVDPSYVLAVPVSGVGGGAGTGTTTIQGAVVSAPPTSTATATATSTPTATATSTGVSNGGRCMSPSQCQSGNCVDEVCCDTACQGPLEQCNLPGQRGVCVSTAAPAPTLSDRALILALVLLIGIGGLAIAQRRWRAAGR